MRTGECRSHLMEISRNRSGSKPDEGIWEVRGGARQFTHSKMMAWVAFDRAVKLAEAARLVRSCRPRALAEDPRQNSPRKFVGAATTERRKPSPSIMVRTRLDASILMMPLVGFLPASDPRVRTTVEAVERELMQDGFVLRYRTGQKRIRWTARHARAHFYRARSGWPIACT